MALLEVFRPGAGDPERVRVTRKKPVTVGNHGSVDVAIEAFDVPALLCRIGWNGEDFEITAAGEQDVQLNGEGVMQAVMGDGDTIEAGGVLLTMRRGGEAKKRADAVRAASGGPVSMEGFSILDDEDMSDVGDPPTPSAAPAAVPDLNEMPDGESDREELAQREKEVEARNKLRHKLRSKQRPGERDPLRSPLLGGLAALIVVLLFSSVVLGLVLRQQSVQAEYDAAKGEQDRGNFAEAIRKYEDFIARHGSNDLADEARRNLELSKVDRLVQAAAPEWPQALDGLETFIGRSRDAEDFDSLRPEIASRAGLVSLGSAVDAGSRRKPDLLGTSQEAEEVLKTYSSEASPPDKLIREVEAARLKSRRQLRTFDVRDTKVAAMQAAAAEDRPLDVLRTYRDMLAAEPTLRRDREARDLRDQALVDLRESITDGATPTGDTQPVDLSVWSPIATAAVVERPAGQEQQAGGPVFAAFVAGTLFGVDTGSGDPLWRVPVGESFAPIAVQSPQAGWLASDPTRPGLLYIGRDGATIAAVELPARPLRPSEGDSGVVVPMDGGRLALVSLQGGEIVAAATLPQPLLARPAVIRGRIVLFGDRDMVYLLDAGTLEAISLLELGHTADSLLAEPISVAGLVAVPLNEGRGSRLVLLELADDGQSVAVVDEASIPGRIVDPPQLRGRDLFVASTGGRATVLTVNDEGGGSITRGPTFVGGGSQNVPTFLRAGSDRQFWMVGERMRRLRTTADTIRPVGRTLLLGQPSQPPEQVGGSLVIASQPAPGRGTQISLVEGESFERSWVLHLGDAPRAVAARSDVPILVTADGYSVRMREDSRTPGFVIDASDRLAGPVTHAATLPEGRIAAVGYADAGQPDASGDETFPVAFQSRGGADGMLTIIAATGRISQRIPLDGVPAVPPVVWREGVVACPPGRLKWVPLDGRSPAPPEFWLAQGGDDPPNWRAVAPVDGETLLTLDDIGTLRAVMWQDSPRQLVGTSESATESLTMLAATEGLVVASDGRQLERVDPQSLKREPFATPLARIDSLHAAGGRIVAAGVDGQARGRLVVVTADGAVPVDAEGPVVGATETAQGLVVTTRDAVLLPSDGGIRPQPLPSPAAGGVIELGEGLAVPLADGTLTRLAGE